MTQGANWANHNPLPSLLIETTENEIILLQLLVALAVFSESSKQGLYMHIIEANISDDDDEKRCSYSFIIFQSNDQSTFPKFRF